MRFIEINVAEFDAHKHAALPLVGDARAALDELLPLLAGYRSSGEYTERSPQLAAAWEAEVERVCGPQSIAIAQSQSAVRNPQSA